MSMARPSARSRGFTLVELLVVLAVIAVMIAMILPAVGEARATAVRVRCGAQMHGIGNGMTAYAIDNRGRFQPAFYSSLYLVTTFIVSPTLGDLWVKDYGMPLKSMICPTLNASLSRWGYNSTTFTPSFQVGYSLNIPALRNLPVTTVGAPLTVPSAPANLQDSPQKTLAADLTIRVGSTWFNTTPWDEVNAHCRRGPRPEGAYSTFLDGHVQWFAADKLGPAAQGIDGTGNFDYAIPVGGRFSFWGVLP